MSQVLLDLARARRYRLALLVATLSVMGSVLAWTKAAFHSEAGDFLPCSKLCADWPADLGEVGP